MLRKRTSFKEEMGALVDGLDLPDLQKKAIKSRWLDQVVLLERKANRAEKNYYRSKIVNIVSSLLLAALVALNVGDIGNQQFKGFVRQWSPAGLIGLSLLVTLSATLEGIGGFGESRRQYRHMVENLKSEGWQFLQLAGSYQQAPSYQEAYSTFSTRVELIIKGDMEIFTAEVVREKESARESARPAVDDNCIAPFPSDDSSDPTAGYEEIAMAMAEEGLEFPDPEIPLPPPLSPSSSISNGGPKQSEPTINRKPAPIASHSTSRATPDPFVGAVPPVRISSPSLASPAETQVRPDNPDARS